MQDHPQIGAGIGGGWTPDDEPVGPDAGAAVTPGPGEDIEIGFNVNYLLDAIGAVDSEEVTLSVVDSNSSCLVRQPGTDDSKFVVMPMRL